MINLFKISAAFLILLVATLSSCKLKDKIEEAATECVTVDYSCMSYEECYNSIEEEYYIEFDGDTYDCNDLTCSNAIAEVTALIDAECP